MTQQINKYIATEIMGKVEPKCNHYWDESYPDSVQHCEYCGFEQLDYCSSLDLIHAVELKVIEKVGESVLADILSRECGYANFNQFATALQRAMACQKAMEGK